MDPNPDGSLPRLGGPAGRAARAGRAGPALREPRRARQARAPGARGAAGRRARAEPDLASVLSGLNDMLRRDCRVGAVIGELDSMIGTLREAGADVLTFTLPDPVPINPIAKARRARGCAT